MNEADEISDVVKTRELLVYDDSNKLRISLYAGTGVEPKIVLHKKDESPAVQISYFEKDNNSGRIIVFGKSGAWRFSITSNDNESGITVWDSNGKFLGSFGLPRT